MLWSILIAAIPSRYHSAQPLLFSLLETQNVAKMPDVELVYLMDNHRRRVGAKRNALLSLAQGEYVSFVDDDDEVAPDYVSRIHGAIMKARKQQPPVDVITFPQRATLSPAGVIHECTYSLEHFKKPMGERRSLAQTDKENVLAWTGPPAHTMVWRREIIKNLRFPEQQFGEDVIFVDEACKVAKTEMVLDGGPLYFYNYNEEKTATR